MVIASTTIDEIKKTVALTERVKRRKDEFLAAIPHVTSERSRLFTQSWKETEGEPITIRRARTDTDNDPADWSTMLLINILSSRAFQSHIPISLAFVMTMEWAFFTDRLCRNSPFCHSVDWERVQKQPI